MYIIEIQGDTIVGKHSISCDVELQENQKEVSKEIFNSIIRMPATFNIDQSGNISIQNAPTQPIERKTVEEPTVAELTHKQINEQVVKKIREKYSIDDEFQMHRLGMTNPNNLEYKMYLSHVAYCIEWGDQMKAVTNIDREAL